jgi:hypothetical protein
MKGRKVAPNIVAGERWAARGATAWLFAERERGKKLD